jgi:hypothetical protein
LLGSALLGMGCSDVVDKPPPPNMTALVEAYENPSGTLNSQTIGATYTALQQTFGWLQVLCGWEEDTLRNPCAGGQRCHVCQGLDPMSTAFVSISDSNDADVRQLSRVISGIDGFVTIRRACPGFGEEATIDPENGGLKVVIGFTSAGLDPTWGGELSDCQVLVDGEENTVNGELSLAFGRSFFLDQLLQQEPIIRFNGSVESDEDVQNFSANLRLSLANGVDVAASFEVPNVGTMVYINGLSGQGIDAANGRFACDFDGPSEQPLQCKNNATGETAP